MKTMNDISIFELLFDDYKPKKVRLIELFAGYGSQNLSLKYLGANYEHYKICEWATKSIQAYNDLHIQDYTDYSKDMSKDEVISYLFNKGISLDYNKPMNLQEIKRKGEPWSRQVYNNIIATNNLVNIQQVKGSDLEIVDTDKYDYLMTYSFPCQDLSLAGKGKGMADTSTRSGMLWEVERILDECYKLGSLPQILLMENVTQVVGTKNIKHFQKWRRKLEDLGYQSYVQNMIAAEYGIPQTRDRTFMLSILGSYNYTFPNKMPLKYRLKNLLENDVNEKYYLNEKGQRYILGNAIDKNLKDMYNRKESYLNKDIAYCINTKPCRRVGDTNYIVDVINEQIKVKDYIKIKEATKKGYAEAHEGDGIYLDRPHQKRGVVQKGMIQTLKTSGNDIGVVVGALWKQDKVISTITTDGKSKVLQNDLRIRKLTPKECFRLMGVKDEDFENIAKNQSNSSLYHLAGDSIVSTVLMAILGKLLGIDYELKINELLEELTKESRLNNEN